MPRDKEVSIPQGLDMETIRRAIDITASVRLPMGKGSPIVWDGTFSRTSESMDLNTGALTIYITVDNPYGQVIPGKRPPLITNMYVAVELKGLPLKERFVIPRNAVRNGQIYLCTPEDRLAIRPVEVEFYMGDVAVLSHGLTEGEILVLADLVPAIEGMRLTPVMAEDTLAILRQQAAGKGELE
jgi:hypothetical protein